MVVGIGLDIEEVERFERILAERPGLVEQVFTSDERSILSALPDPARGFTAAFAVKEAAFKALGQGWLESALFWSDIELLSPPDAPNPTLRLSGPARQRGAALGVDHLRASIACLPGIVLAQVFLLRELPGAAT